MTKRFSGICFAIALLPLAVACSDDGSVAPICRADGDCQTGQICRDFACAEPECRTDDDCFGASTCNAGLCEGDSDVGGDVLDAGALDADASDGSGAGADVGVDAGDGGDGGAPDVEDGGDAGTPDVPDIDWGPLEFTTDPAPRSVNVARDASVVVTFNQPMFDLSFTQNNVRLGPPTGDPVERTITYDRDAFVLTVTPNAPLEASSPWVFRLSEFVGSAAGERLGDPWTMEFSTATYDGAAYHHFLANAYAPVVLQQVEEPTIDTFTTIDFDGDLLPGNNLDNATAAPPGRMYYAVIETTTHWYITYVIYYAGTRPNDRDVAEHDMLGAQVVVQKLDGDPTGVLRSWSTFYRIDYSAWAMESPWYADGATVGGDLAGRLPASQLEGARHVQLFIESGHHAICLADVGVGRCRPAAGASAPFEDGTTATTWRAGEVASVVGSGPGDALTYELVPFIDGMWVYRNRTTGPEAVFGGRVDYRPPSDGDAARPGEGLEFPTSLQSEHDGDTFGSLPFSFARGTEFPPDTGVWFVDPAWLAAQMFDMPEGVALDYCFNPYLGVDARDALEGCTPSSFEVD